MISLEVTEKDKDFAKKQIEDFEKIKQGKWRYNNVEAWRGVVCEMITSKWLEQNFKVEKIQFYNANRVILWEKDTNINSKKTSGKIKTSIKFYKNKTPIERNHAVIVKIDPNNSNILLLVFQPIHSPLLYKNIQIFQFL